MRTAAFVVACALTGFAQQPQGFSHARYQSGSLPPLPVNVVGGGEVILEVDVSARGLVTAIKPLRTTPPFTELVTAAVRGWRFAPAMDDAPGRQGEPAARMPVESTLTVAAVFRPPALSGPTLGEVPKNVAAASTAAPFPLDLVMPPFPPMASTSGVVLLEASVDGRGVVTATTVIRSAPPFDDAAQKALAQWKFRPARAGAAARVYVLCGFSVPVGIGSPGE